MSFKVKVDKLLNLSGDEGIKFKPGLDSKTKSNIELALLFLKSSNPRLF